MGLCGVAIAGGAGAQDLTWGLSLDGGWNTTEANWVLADGTPVTFADGSSVTFGGPGVVPTVVTLDDASVAATGVNFVASDYTIASDGAALTAFGGAMDITLSPRVTAAIAAPLATAATDIVTVTGGAGSALSLNGDNSAAPGALSVDGGEVTVAGTYGGAVTVADGVVRNSGTIVGAVSVNGGRVEGSGMFTGGVTLDETGTKATELALDASTLRAQLRNVDGSVTATNTTFEGGIAQEGGTLQVAGSDLGTGLVVTGGAATIDGAEAATTIGAVSNRGGRFTIAGNQTLEGNLDTETDTARSQIDGRLVGDARVTDGRSVTTGTLDGALTMTDGVAEVTGGRITGNVAQDGGRLELSGATLDQGLDLRGGRVFVLGDSAGDIRNTGGNVVIEAGQTLTGDIVQSAGRLTQRGVIDGTFEIDSGSVTATTGSDVTGQTTLRNGTLAVEGGAFGGGLRLEGGRLRVTGTIIGDIETAQGMWDFAADQVIDGDLRNTGAVVEYAGRVKGDLTVIGGRVTTLDSAVTTGATRVTGGALMANGGVFADGLRVDGGAVTTGGDISAGGLVVQDGTFDLSLGTRAASDLEIAGGLATLAGEIAGDVTQNGGEGLLSGSIAGEFVQSGGAFRLDGGAIGGAVAISGGTFTADGGTLAAGLRNDGGRVAVAGVVTGDIVNDGGTLVFETAGNLTGNVVNAARVVADGGVLSGDLENRGILDVSQSGLDLANLTSTGDVTVAEDQRLGFASAAFADGGALRVEDGMLAGDVAFAAGADIDVSDLTVEGDLTSFATFASNGAFAVTGDMMLDAGAVTFETGTAAIDGTLAIAEGARVALQDGTTLEAGVLENRGTVTTGGDVALDVMFANAAVLTGSGTLSFAGGLQNTGTVNLMNGAPGDQVAIAGEGLSGGGVLAFDVDLSDAEGAADRVVLGPAAMITGDVTLAFNVLGSGGQQAEDILLIDVAADDPGDFTIIADEIVDPSGILTYSVTRNAAGDVVIEDGLNPGIAGLAGNIVLTQSLIGSVVNRPSSPFVTTLAYDDADPCGAGLWGRSLAGGAQSSGEVVQDGEDGRAFDGTIAATFAGIQLGGDVACFNGVFEGWDLALGAIGGVNFGTTTQPVFAIDVNSPTNLSDLQTGTTDVAFTQAYAGVYGTAVRGPLAFDLQYRFEGTDFSATNEGAGDLPGLGLDDTTFRSTATTLSGAVSYVHNLEGSDLALVPTAGFAYTQVSTDPITFMDRGTVQIADFDSQIGFVGGTLAQSSFGDDGVSAYRQFLSATVYNDFAEGPRSTFSPIDDSGDRGLQTENLGLYSEVSFGVNYVRVLQENEFGAVKQLSANARADLRLSPRLQSWGVTAQARVQF